MFSDQRASKYSHRCFNSDGTICGLNSVKEFHVVCKKSFVFSKFSSRIVKKP